MTFKLIFIQIFFLVICGVVRLEDQENENNAVVKETTERERGISIAWQALDVFINGDKPGAKTYKDLFIDTSKTVFDQLDMANVQVTVDDMLRIFIQSVLILIAERRADLIPDDFNQRHKAYGDAIDNLNVLLDTLNEKGTGQVTIGAMKNLIQNLKSDEFWEAISSLQREVSEKIRLEPAESPNEKGKKKLKIKSVKTEEL